MSVPYFYIDSYDGSQELIELPEETSRHVIQVLRMKKGENLNLTDGKGTLFECEIVDDHKKHSIVGVKSKIKILKSKIETTVAISLIKNTDRFEWFLEKATEIGVSEIIPLICERTEKEKFRYDRMKGICISAMLQSQQVWLPVLQEPVTFKQVIDQVKQQQKFIAHCITGEKRNLAAVVDKNLYSRIILIGPEGDFTKEEADLAGQHQFTAVSLGETRLRTETAGVVAATILNIV